MHWQLLTAVLIVAAPAPPEKDKKDEDKIQGTWVVVSLEHGGQKGSDDEVKDVKFVFKEGALTVNEPRKEEKAKIKLDAAKKPKTIDVTMEGDKRVGGIVVPGIYELKDDELKLCFTKGGGARPTEFVSKPGSEVSLIVLKREKKEK